MRSLKTGLAGALTICASVSMAGGVVAEPITSYEAYAAPSSFNKTPFASPRWTAALDAEGPTTVVTAEGKALFLRGGVLTAVDVDTGNVAWTAGSGLRDGFQRFGDRVLAATGDGKLLWIDLATGKTAWTVALRDSAGPEEQAYVSAAAADDAVYVSSSDGITAFDRETGKKLWNNDTFENVGFLSLRGEHLLHVTAEQGALTVIANYGIDRETGETLWRLGGSHGALERIEGDIGWFRDDWSPIFAMETGPSVVPFDLVDLNTGEIV
ncbi:MAG TPA: PQQ-binding-like beta-propeller repeat protein, partial [Paenibacillus sp.]|nr:PQQ-binding-like beta-propeller repeat protein [Paenibacillus sp.]